MNFKTAGLLLAAGLSSRMGKLKALLPWKGMPLIQYQIEQMKEADIDEIIVVLGYQAEHLQKIISACGTQIVINKHYEYGKSSSIRKGISSLQKEVDGIFISAVDQPVPSAILKTMKAHLEKNEAAVVVPTYETKRGHPILLHASTKNDLLVINEETLGLRSIIRKYKKQITYLEVNHPSILLNFNKQEDYDKNIREASNESFQN